MKQLAFIGVICAAAAALFVGLSSTVSQDGVAVGIRSADACTKEGPAECLPNMSYIDTEGTMWTPEALAGKVVMVNFWASWCRPCKAEIPALSASYARHAEDGFVLLGVMTDAGQVSPEALASFSEQYDLDYPVVPVDGDIWGAYDGPESLPMTFIYDRTGSLRVRHRGALSEAQLEEVLAELLAEPTPQV